MERIYNKYKDYIISLFHIEDIPSLLIYPLKDNFDKSAINRIKNSTEEKVELFFEEFDKITLLVKYINFIEVSSDISEWIAAFLISEDDGKKALKRFNISKNLINQNMEFFIDQICIDQDFLRRCLEIKLITPQTLSLLTDTLQNDGELVKHRFSSLIHVHSLDCYAQFLFICWKFLPIYLELFCCDLYALCIHSNDDEEALSCIKVYTIDVIDNSDYDPNASSSLPVLELSSLDPKIYSELPLSELSSFGSCSLAFSSFNTDTKTTVNSGDSSDDDDMVLDADLDALFGYAKDKSLPDVLNFRSETLSTNDDDRLHLRQYQEELATKGLEGKNVLICAPTSSGKTVVALKIAAEHLKANRSGKVAFVVPTTVLADQQYSFFKKYLERNLKIIKLTGGTKSFSVLLSMQIQYYDIFVFTADILKNSLEDEEEPLKSISEFSLIMFDECHHCDKDHSYNKVMDHYFRQMQGDKAVPQIIGMTASTGTDKAKNLEAALSSLMSLCANLDCEMISTVNINVEELKNVLPTPSDEVKPTGARLNDLFENNLISLMDKAERKLDDIFRPKNKNIGIPTDRYLDKYLSFVKGISNFCPTLLSDEERKGVTIIEIYLENLYRALLINHLFNYEHAKKTLLEKIGTKAPCTCEVEVYLRSLLREFLSSGDLHQDPNPCLELLKEEIVKQIREDKKSKIIVFVKEVIYTRFLENEIEAAKLGFIRGKALVGTNKSSDQGGLSKSETDEIVSRFRKGINNLLFATSVAEEGLDVKACNLVIRYGHVTNEISMVQCRGRARASNSKYIVIIPEKLRWQVNKENINKVRESLMYKAIEKFQEMDLTRLRKELFKYHEKRQALRTFVTNDNSTDTPTKPLDNSDWLMCCDKCKIPLCSSKDIRLANGTSYINVNKDTHGNLKMRKGGPGNYPITCSSCHEVVGFSIKVGGYYVPNISVSKCVLKKGDERLKKKKWKDVPFKVDAVKHAELFACHSDAFDHTTL